MQEQKIQYPFIPCNLDNHKRFSPLTAISHIRFDKETDDSFELCCTQCLNKRLSEVQTIKSQCIEEYIDDLAIKTRPSEESKKIFEEINSFIENIPTSIRELEEKHEKATAQFLQFTQTVLSKIQTILEFTEKHFCKTRELLLEGFRESYSLITRNIERLLIQHRESSSSYQLEFQAKIENMKTITSAKEYYECITDLKELSSSGSCEVTEEIKNLKKFMDLTKDEAKVLDVPFMAIILGNKIVDDVKEQLTSFAKKMSFVRIKTFESFLEPIIENVKNFDDPNTNLIVENLSSTICNLNLISKYLNDERSFEEIVMELKLLYP